MSAQALDFGYNETLVCQTAGRGRLFFGNAAGKSAGNPTLLLVHGGYHGAWCFADYLRYFDDAGIPSAAMDMRGHGGLPQDADYPFQGVRNMAEDVVACCAALPGPAVPVGHSVGALVAAAAGELTRFFGLGLLAPSPPGQLPGLQPLAPVPTGAPIAPPDARACREKFLQGEAAGDISAFADRLCPESPQVLNDRYSLSVDIDPVKFGMPAICISAGLDRGELHPEGQDLDTARFFNAEYHCIDDDPHCMMVGAGWRASADILADWYRRIAPSASLSRA